jgi:hypothetical protein
LTFSNLDTLSLSQGHFRTFNLRMNKGLILVILLVVGAIVFYVGSQHGQKDAYALGVQHGIAVEKKGPQHHKPTKRRKRHHRHPATGAPAPVVNHAVLEDNEEPSPDAVVGVPVTFCEYQDDDDSTEQEMQTQELPHEEKQLIVSKEFEAAGGEAPLHKEGEHHHPSRMALFAFLIGVFGLGALVGGAIMGFMFKKRKQIEEEYDEGYTPLNSVDHSIVYA